MFNMYGKIIFIISLCVFNNMYNNVYVFNCLIKNVKYIMHFSKLL